MERNTRRAKHRFTDNCGDVVDLYQFSDAVFMDCMFEGGKLPNFRAIFSAESARAMAKVLNKLADKIEGKEHEEIRVHYLGE